jgi:hypothetical protein
MAGKTAKTFEIYVIRASTAMSKLFRSETCSEVQELPLHETSTAT